ncbi:PAS domain-containing protein [Alkalihalobacillus deserti]|uniref:PAS domain-containing protein n=1 Tax=Alkalihalobacillus deserti TaxID=2879466 RepID=UPI0025A46676|nr:diguanylate cyclase [Alkalihalobacillus deserti]
MVSNIFVLMYMLTVIIYMTFLILINPFTWYMVGFLFILFVPVAVLTKVIQTNVVEKKELQQRIEKLIEKEEETEQDLNEVNQINKVLNIGHLSFDVNDQSVSISENLEDIFGYKIEEFQRNPFFWQEVANPEDISLLIEQENSLLLGKSTKYKYRILHSNGNPVWLINSATPIYDSNGKLAKSRRAFIDITKEKETEEKLRQLAFYDDLTELPNRKMLETHMKKALARSKRHNHTMIVMFIDLDGFKKVNDSFGLESGDLLLKEVAESLFDSVREEDLIVRLGGENL